MRDESDRDGLRIVMELKRDAIPQIVLNKLYKHTQMQSTFGTILLALVNGEPRVLPLRDMLLHFIEHRHTVVVKRTAFDLAKAQDREHILEGLKIAVDNIDAVIKIIRGSRDAETASITLQESFELSERQAKAILDMRLARLTGLEMEKLEAELAEIRAAIEGLQAILASRDVRMEIISDELTAIDAKYGDDRRSEIVGAASTLDVEDLIADEEMVITVSRQGYVKRAEIDTYRAQRRGGRGLQGMGTKDEDWVEHLFVATAHQYLMIFTRSGQCHWLKVWQVPPAGRQSKGKPIVNLLPLEEGERINAILPTKGFDENNFVFMATSEGTVKKTSLSLFSRPRASGIIAIDLRNDDRLVDVAITDGEREIVLVASSGKAIHFKEKDVRPMGRGAAGVRGIKLTAEHEVIALCVVSGGLLLSATENGYGKRTSVDEFPIQGRGGQGVIAIQTSTRNGRMIGALQVREDDEIMLISSSGTLVRTPVSEISIIGRNTQGVRLIRMQSDQRLVGLARIAAIEDKKD